MKGRRYASREDLEWIWRVQGEAGETELEVLWRHVVHGDAWHRRRFAEAWVGTTWGEYSPVGEAFKQGTTWGIYQAPEEYQDDSAFLFGVWAWRAAQAAVAVPGGAAVSKLVGGWLAGSGGAVAAAGGSNPAVREQLRQIAMRVQQAPQAVITDHARITEKIARQMGPRGWTLETIEEAIRGGRQISAVNKATGNPAIRYVHPRTGRSVVVDAVTQEVIHVGGAGFKYGPGSGDLP